MNRNQKIALGCGGAGCLGLIVLVAAAAVLYFYYRRSPSDTNRNSDIGINSNLASNGNSSSKSADDTSSSNDTPSSSMSDDDKHKLFQAAGATGDASLTQRVLGKIGLVNANGTPTDDFQQFTKDHFAWAMRNVQFIQSINTPEKARAYVDAHIDD